MAYNGNSYTLGVFVSDQIIEQNNKQVFFKWHVTLLSTQDINKYLYVFWIFNIKILEMMISVNQWKILLNPRKVTFLDIQLRV